MIKKLFFFIFFIVVHNNSKTMEESIEHSIENNEELSLAELLPNELVVHTIQIKTHSDAPIELSEDRKSCIQFGPNKNYNRKSLQIILFSQEQWEPSINLNPGEIIFKNTKSNEYFLFFAQRWCKDKAMHYSYYHGTDYRINSAQRRHFLPSLERKHFFFDGPNKENLFLIARNLKHKQTIEGQYINRNKKKGICSILGSSKKKRKKSVIDRKEVKEAYEYYLGKLIFPEKAQNIYKKEANNFDYISPRIIGTISALALYNFRSWNPENPRDNNHRYALTDDKEIVIYEIEESNQQPSSQEQSNQENKLSMQKIGFGKLKKKKKRDGVKLIDKIKKLSFITQKTLLGLSEDGKLFSFALDQQKSKVTSHVQHIKKNKESKDLYIHTFALNTCAPHQAVLCTRGRKILYLNLKDCIETNKGRVKFLMRAKRLPDSMWFYDTMLCLNHFPFETKSYLLIADLDLRLEKLH